MKILAYIKKIISKDKRLYYYQNNIIEVCKKLKIKQIFNIIPLLDNENYFYYFSFDWRKNLYDNLEKKDKLYFLFIYYIPFFLDNSFQLEDTIKEEYKKIWSYLKDYYINQYENFVLNDKIIINKDFYFMHQKYLNFRNKIQLPNGEIIDLRLLILDYINNKKKISKKTILFLHNNYLNEMKICKYYLMKK